MMFCVSNSIVQKTPSQNGRLLLCFKRSLGVTQKKTKLFLCYSCVQQFVFNLGNRTYQPTRTSKQFKNQILKQNSFTVPRLESQNRQFVRFDLILIQPVKTYIEKKNASDYWFLKSFFWLSDFYSFFDLEIHNRMIILSKTWIFIGNFSQKNLILNRNYFEKINVLTQLTP